MDDGMLRDTLTDMRNRLIGLEAVAGDIRDRLARLEEGRAGGIRTGQSIRDWLGWIAAVAMVVTNLIKGRWVL